jgi:hypothetical protein
LVICFLFIFADFCHVFFYVLIHSFINPLNLLFIFLIVRLYDVPKYVLVCAVLALQN